MALKDLSPQQMVSVTEAWVDPARERPRLQARKRVAPLLEDIEAAHEGVRRAHGKEKKTSTEVTEIQARQLAVDKTHDRKARGTHAILTGFADLADDPEDASAYLDIRTQLFPDGLKFITKGYADEAGEVQIARERLTPEAKAALKVLPTPSGTLLKAVQAWFAAGEELGKLEARRAQIEADTRPAEGTVQGGQLKARNRWIKVVTSVLSMLELEDVDADDLRHILAPLHRALAKAERRRAGDESDDSEQNGGEGGSEAPA